MCQPKPLAFGMIWARKIQYSHLQICSYGNLALNFVQCHIQTHWRHTWVRSDECAGRDRCGVDSREPKINGHLYINRTLTFARKIIARANLAERRPADFQYEFRCFFHVFRGCAKLTTIYLFTCCEFDGINDEYCRYTPHILTYDVDSFWISSKLSSCRVRANFLSSHFPLFSWALACVIWSR